MAKTTVWWYFALGDADTTVDQRQDAQPSPLITGVRGGHDLDLHRLAADGVVLLGRVLGGRDGRLTIARDLSENLAHGDASLIDFTRRADEQPLGMGWTFHLPIRVSKS